MLQWQESHLCWFCPRYIYSFNEGGRDHEVGLHGLVIVMRILVLDSKNRANICCRDRLVEWDDKAIALTAVVVTRTVGEGGDTETRLVLPALRCTVRVLAVYLYSTYSRRLFVVSEHSSARRRDYYLLDATSCIVVERCPHLQTRFVVLTVWERQIPHCFRAIRCYYTEDLLPFYSWY